MTTLEYLRDVVIPAAYRLLPDRCASQEATAFLLAIALQESGAEHRRQLGPGPARGFWQFERAGVAAVLSHQASQPLLMPALNTLQYPGTAYACHVAVEHNDILAMVFARLLIWTLPVALPGERDVMEAWRQYLAAWRPGRPRFADWPDNYAAAWHHVTGLTHGLA